MNDMQTLFKRASELEAQATPYALVTVIRALAPTSAKPGDKAIVCADGTIYGWIGGGCAQPAVVRTVRQALDDGKARNIRITPDSAGQQILEDIIEFTMACHSGGTIELFIEPVVPKPELVVFGTSPVAQSLVSLGPRVGFRVTWVGEAAALADPSDEIRRIGEQELERIPAGAFAVVATQGKGDLQGLKRALAIRPVHIGFVASRRKGDLLKESLVSSGCDPEAVAAIEAPAGRAIEAQTPEEIALSVLASLVAKRRAGARATTPPHVEAAAALTARASSATTPAAIEMASSSCCNSEAAELAPAAMGAASCCAEPAAGVETAAPKPAAKRSCCSE